MAASGAEPERVGKSLVARAYGGLLVKPQTRMNLSGEALLELRTLHAFEASEVLIVVDDINLPLGTLRLRVGGSTGGHNGLRNVEWALGTIEYPRLRIGVGEAPDDAQVDLREFVLAPFAAAEEPRVEEAVGRAKGLVTGFLHGDALTRLAACYNGGPDRESGDGASRSRKE